MDREFCDFVVYSEADLFTERIYRSRSFWREKMFPKLISFFYLVYLPELSLKQIKKKHRPINLSKYSVDALFT